MNAYQNCKAYKWTQAKIILNEDAPDLEARYHLDTACYMGITACRAGKFLIAGGKPLMCQHI